MDAPVQDFWIQGYFQYRCLEREAKATPVSMLLLPSEGELLKLHGHACFTLAHLFL